jgi:hypothetical protein
VQRLTPTKSPPACAVHSASAERSLRSPAPQFRRCARCRGWP